MRRWSEVGVSQRSGRPKCSEMNPRGPSPSNRPNTHTFHPTQYRPGPRNQKIIDMSAWGGGFRQDVTLCL